LKKKIGRPAYQKYWKESINKPICPIKLAEAKANWKPPTK